MPTNYGATHHLKTHPKYFDAVARGEKTFEVRKNDRDFQPGDVVVLQRWDPDTRDYSRLRAKMDKTPPYEDLVFDVGFVLPGNFFGEDNWCAFSLIPRKAPADGR